MSSVRAARAVLLVDEASFGVVGPEGAISVRAHAQLDRLASELMSRGLEVTLATAARAPDAHELLLVWGKSTYEAVRTRVAASGLPRLPEQVVLLDVQPGSHQQMRLLGVPAFVDLHALFLWNTGHQGRISVSLLDHLAGPLPTLPGEERRSYAFGYTSVWGLAPEFVPIGLAAVARAVLAQLG